MGRVSLDLKKFKHVKSDKDTTTLQHKDGHMLTISHNKLNPEFKAQLEAIKPADKEEPQKFAYGETKVQAPPQKDPAPTPPQPKEHNIPANLNGPSSLSDAVSRLMHPMASGGKVQSGSLDMNYAEGGIAGKSGAYDAGLPCLNPNCKSHGKPHPNCRCYAGHAEGGEVVHYCRYGKAHGGICEYYKDGGEVRKMYADPLGPIEEGDDAPVQTDAPPTNQAPAQSQPIASDQTSQDADIEKEIQDANPEPSQTLPQNSPYQENQTPMPMASKEPNPSQNPSAQEKAEDQAWAHDLANGHITPKTYSDLWQNKSTPQKIAGLFGILVGGIGSGLTGQPNAALQMMDKVISNDLEAQKQSKTNAQNHWNLNYQHALQEAQANGMDANAEHTRESAKTLADARTHMQANRAAFQQLVDLTDKIPNNDPRKVQFLKAISTIGTQVDLQNSNLSDKYEMQNTLINDKFGHPSDSTISNPKGSAVKPKQDQSAMPGKPVGQVPPEGQDKDEDKSDAKSQKYNILSPDATRKYKNIMNGYDPQWSPKSELINQQYTQAQQAEKMLNGPKGDGKGGVHDIMNQMHEAWGNMGLYGHLHNKVQEIGSALPIVGGAAGAATQLFPNTQSEKKFNALKTTLESDMGTALQGIMTPTDIHSAVEKYAPAYQDTKKDVAFKEEQLVNAIKKALRTSAISGAGLVK